MKWLFFALIWSNSLFGQSDQEIELQQERLPLGGKSSLIARVDLSHYHEVNLLNDELVESNQMQMRGKLGLQLWNGTAELLGVFGAAKDIHTQKIMQKRPYIELSLFPLVGEYGQILQYHIVSLPFSDASYDFELKNPALQGVIYTIGIAPTFVWSHRFDWLSIDLKSGFDIWTKLYTRDQTLDKTQISEADALALQDTGNLIDDNSTWLGAWMAGFSLSPGYLRRGSLTIAAYGTTRQYPYYELENGIVKDHYKVERSSYYLGKFKYAINSNLVISNEFYMFFKDFFTSRIDDENQSYRNIMRLTFHL